MRPCCPEVAAKHTRERLVNLRALLSELLADYQEFTLEIGCGNGHFLSAYAQAHPDKYCIGIDLLGGRLERANKKRKRLEISNLHFIKADAEEFLASLPEHVRIAETFILFPDPWPKRRHHKHRLIQEKFLEDIAHKSLAESHLYFRSDYTPYVEWVANHIETCKEWTLIESPWPFEQSTLFQERAESHKSLISKRLNPEKHQDKHTLSNQANA